MSERGASLLEQRLTTFRAAVLARDEATLRALAAAFDRVVSTLEAEVTALARQLAQDGLLSGGLSEEAALNRLFRLGRYRALLTQADEELARLLGTAERAIRSEQLALVRAGARHAEALVAAAQGAESAIVAGFSRLPVGAITELVGATRSGAPLAELLARYGDDAARAITDELLAGMARGDSPDVVARLIRDRLVAIGGGTTGDGAFRLGRLQGLARDSILDAYRRSTLAVYSANPDLLSGWQWAASLSPRTCAACLSLHGEVFPLSEQFFPRHPRCRCAAVPVIKGEDPPLAESGEDWLARQPASVKAGTLGREGAAAFDAGDLRLIDWVLEEESAVWGRSFRQDGLTGARLRATRRRRAA